MTVPNFADLGSAIRGVCNAWCEEQGYTDPFCRNGEWWAYPPNGVMGSHCQRPVRLGPLTLFLYPDGSVAPELQHSSFEPY